MSVRTVFYPERIDAATARNMPVIMARVATEYTNEVKRLMRDSPASGVERKSAVSRRRHRASAPGEPPAPDSGRLIKSIRFRVRRMPFTGNWAAEAGSDVKYALPLEFGAARGVRGRSGRIEQVQWILFPRPAWGPAMRVIRARMPAILRMDRR